MLYSRKSNNYVENLEDNTVKKLKWISLQIIVLHVCFVFHITPTAKVIWKCGHSLIGQTGDVGIEPATPGLQGKGFIHYTTASPIVLHI